MLKRGIVERSGDAPSAAGYNGLGGVHAFLSEKSLNLIWLLHGVVGVQEGHVGHAFGYGDVAFVVGRGAAGIEQLDISLALSDILLQLPDILKVSDSFSPKRDLIVVRLPDLHGCAFKGPALGLPLRQTPVQQLNIWHLVCLEDPV